MKRSSSRGPSASPEDPPPAQFLKALSALARIRSKSPTEASQADIDILHQVLGHGSMPSTTDPLEIRIPTNKAPGEAVVLWHGYRPGDPIPPRDLLVRIAVPSGAWPHAVEALRRERFADRATIAIATALLDALGPEGIRAAITTSAPWYEAARIVIVGLCLARSRMDATEWHRRRAAVIDAVGEMGVADPCAWMAHAESRAKQYRLKQARSGEWSSKELTDRPRNIA